jgi:hypothetical protein
MRLPLIFFHAKTLSICISFSTVFSLCIVHSASEQQTQLSPPRHERLILEIKVFLETATGREHSDKLSTSQNLDLVLKDLDVEITETNKFKFLDLIIDEFEDFLCYNPSPYEPKKIIDQYNRLKLLLEILAGKINAEGLSTKTKNKKSWFKKRYIALALILFLSSSATAYFGFKLYKKLKASEVKAFQDAEELRQEIQRLQTEISKVKGASKKVSKLVVPMCYNLNQGVKGTVEALKHLSKKIDRQASKDTDIDSIIKGLSLFNSANTAGNSIAGFLDNLFGPELPQPTTKGIPEGLFEDVPEFAFAPQFEAQFKASVF